LLFDRRISYLAVIASLVAMRLPPFVAKRITDSMLAQVKEGWAYVSGFAPVRTILLLFVKMVSLMGWPFTVLMPIFAGKNPKRRPAYSRFPVHGGASLVAASGL